MATIKGLTLEIGGEVTPLNKALASVNKTSRDLKGELRDVERLLKLDPTNTDLLNQRQKILGETVNATKEKLEKLKEAEKQAQEQFQKGEISEEQYRALQREVIKTEKDLEKFEEQLKKTNPKLEEFGAKAKETGEKLKDVGGKLTKGVTAPLVAAGAGLVAVGTKFDDVYDNIRIGTGATGEALQELNEDFRQIAKQTPASLDDVGVAVADYNTRLGISGKALQDLSQQTLELARITESDLSTTIEETSQSFQAFNLPAEEYGKSLDFIFKVSQSTGIEINRLQQNMVKFSPTLKTLGFDFEQSAVLMGQLDKAGVDVEQAMAGLTKSMGTLAKKGVTDANEAIKILFGQIKDAPSDMEGANAALEIFGAKAGPALAKSIREGKFEFQDLLKELQGSDETILGVADETKDFAERFVELKNNVMIALEPLGEQLFNAINGLIPLFQKIVEFIGNLIQKFVDLSPATQKVVLIVAGLAAALGPLLSLVGTMITLIGSMTTAAAGLGITLNAMLGWVGLIALAITALVGVMAWWISSSDDQVKQSEKLVEQAEQERRAYEDLKAAQEDKMQASLAEIGYTQQLWHELQTLTDENGNVTEANETRARFIVGELNSALGTELELINGKIKGLQGEQTEIENLIEKQRAQRILEAEQAAYDEAKIKVRDLEIQQADVYMQKLSEEQALKEAQAEFDAAFEEVDAFRSSQAAARIKEAQENLESLGEAYNTNEGTLIGYYTIISDYESDYAALMSNDSEKIKAINAGVGESFKTAADSSKEELEKQVATTGIVYAEIQKKVDEGVKGVTQTMADEALVNYQKATEEYKKVGGAIPAGMEVGIENGTPALKNKVLGFISTIKGWFTAKGTGFDVNSPSKWAAELGGSINEGLAKGIIDHQGESKAATQKLVDGVKAQIETLNDSIDATQDEIKQLEKDKKSADDAVKKSIEAQIEAKREQIETIRDNIKTLQDEQKQYEETAKSYVEASELIKKGLTGATDNIELTKDKSSNTYKLWLAVYGEGATEAEKLRKQEENLTDQYNIQGETVDATEAAYQLMVEQYGENYEGSRKLENQLLQERIAYEELYNSIIDVREAKSELTDNSAANLRAAQTSYGDFLAKNYKSLSNFGISASDIFTTARKASGLDKAESAVKSITVNQNITTTAATPSEIREAARDGATLATKEAYA